LRIKRGIEEYTVNIVGVSSRRGPAKVAITLYEETEESQAQREEAREQRRLIKAPAARPEGRPDKRDRRKIRKFLRKE
ncbi:MAG: RNA-binding protein, partial [Candidatus Electrothrix sp. EH2]|nr:RNA-binding protein [Candidatus Electrothrix sp. EH2]